MRPRTYLIFPVALIFLALLSLASLAHAESVIWTQVQPDLFDNTKGTRGFDLSTMFLLDPAVSITYGASASEVDASGNKVRTLACGSSVPQGTKILFEFKPHVYTDVYWFGTGYDNDTPYGTWVANAQLPGNRSEICTAKNQYALSYKGFGVHAASFAELSIAPPEKRVTVGGSGAACEMAGSMGNTICAFNQTGDVSATFTFDPTSGYFYGGEKTTPTRGGGVINRPCEASGRPMSEFVNATSLIYRRTSYQLKVPTQTITCPITVVATDPDSEAPLSPNLTTAPTAGASAGACVVGVPHTISMTATDPHNDDLKYGIDWDADGSVDEFIPPTGYTPSGAPQTASRTYSTSGSKTVKVLAQDSNGLSSGWSSVTFSCTAPQTAGQCTDNADNDGDGKIDVQDPDCTTSGGVSEFTFTPPPTTPPPTTPTADLRLTVPSLVGRGKTVQVVWSADNITSCLPVSGTNGDSFAQLHLGSTFFSPIGGKTSSPITARTTYTLSCIDLNGITRTKTATVNIQPNFRER